MSAYFDSAYIAKCYVNEVDSSRSSASAETNGALFAIHLRMRPGGGPPVMHRHDPSEVYYVIAGEFTFYVQGRRTRSAPHSEDWRDGTPGRRHFAHRPQ